MAANLMFVLLALAVSLIVDLDRPATGIIRVPQQPMLDLQQSIRSEARPDVARVRKQAVG